MFLDQSKITHIIYIGPFIITKNLFNVSYLLESMPEINSDKKSQVSTLRLPTKLIAELKKEASYEKVNFNSLVTKILSTHILWGRYERKVGLLPMTKPFVNAAIHRLNAEIIRSKCGQCTNPILGIKDNLPCLIYQ